MVLEQWQTILDDLIEVVNVLCQFFIAVHSLYSPTQKKANEEVLKFRCFMDVKHSIA
jgi:hypothetical protein